MNVHVWLRGYLWQYAPDKDGQGQFVMEMGEGATIRDLLDSLVIPYWATKDIYLNGARAAEDEILHDGDNLRIYPQIFAGG